jgi:hypothetical protein
VLFQDLILKQQERLVADEVCVDFSLLNSCLFGMFLLTYSFLCLVSFHCNSAVYFVSSFLKVIAGICCGPGMQVTHAASCFEGTS